MFKLVIELTDEEKGYLETLISDTVKASILELKANITSDRQRKANCQRGIIISKLKIALNPEHPSIGIALTGFKNLYNKE